MKYITFTVPCYNSQDYMERCIDSLLPGGEDVEIIIVNDGSTDATARIADDYAARYPGYKVMSCLSLYVVLCTVKVPSLQAI